MVFPSWSNFFLTPSLNVQFFQTVSKANNFFLRGKSQNNFFTIYFVWFSAHRVKFLRCHHIYLHFSPFFDKESNCVEYVEQNCWSCINNFNFWSKVSVLDRLRHKLEGGRSEPKIFITIFPHYNLLIKHFFSIISWTNYYFPTSSWTNYLFSKICRTIFFSQKTIAHPINQMVCPLPRMNHIFAKIGYHIRFCTGQLLTFKVTLWYLFEFIDKVTGCQIVLVRVTPTLYISAFLSGSWTRKCGPGWDDNVQSDYCYQFNRQFMTWISAQSTCRRNGGTLASVTSPHEQSYINGEVIDISRPMFSARNCLLS